MSGLACDTCELIILSNGSSSSRSDEKENAASFLEPACVDDLPSYGSKFPGTKFPASQHGTETEGQIKEIFLAQTGNEIGNGTGDETVAIKIVPALCITPPSPSSRIAALEILSPPALPNQPNSPGGVAMGKSGCEPPMQENEQTSGRFDENVVIPKVIQLARHGQESQKEEVEECHELENPLEILGLPALTNQPNPLIPLGGVAVGKSGCDPPMLVNDQTLGGLAVDLPNNGSARSGSGCQQEREEEYPEQLENSNNGVHSNNGVGSGNGISSATLWQVQLLEHACNGTCADQVSLVIIMLYILMCM